MNRNTDSVRKKCYSVLELHHTYRSQYARCDNLIPGMNVVCGWSNELSKPLHLRTSGHVSTLLAFLDAYQTS